MDTTQLMHAKETAERLHISTGTLYKLARNKEIPHVRIGKRWLFEADAIERTLAEKRRGPTRAHSAREQAIEALRLAAEAIQNAAELLERTGNA